MSLPTENARFGFIGSGRMGTALVRGLLKAGLATADGIVATDVLASAAESLARETGCRIAGGAAEVCEHSDVVFLCVKPQNIAEVLQELRPQVTRDHLVVSIAAGITLAQLEGGLEPGRRVVRVMPNTPCLVGAGASAYSLGSAASGPDATLVERVFSSVGVCYRLPEPLLDAVTGLSGSGPAFVYLIVEALSDGGVRMGLPREVATGLAVQTVLGSARMVQETGKHPGELKDAVASPGGTTIAGLHALERGGLRAALIDAVEAATRRSQELGRGAAGDAAPKPLGRHGV